MTKRMTSLTTAALVVCSVPALTGATSPAVAADHPAAVATAFALQASGFGSSAESGPESSGSDATAFANIGCTNKAGLDRTATQAGVPGTDGFKESNLHTHVWTAKKGGLVNSTSQGKLQKVTIASTSAGDLVIKDIESMSHTWHSGSGFHTNTTSSVGSIVLHPATGPDVTYPIPDPGDALSVPGVASITRGSGSEKTSAEGATASIWALEIKEDSSGSTTYLASTSVGIHRGMTDHLFGGTAYGSQSTGPKNASLTAPNPVVLMPCQGTAGDVVAKSVAYTAPNGDTHAKGSTVREMSVVKGGLAKAWESSRVDRTNIAPGLYVKNLIGRAYAQRSHGVLTRNTHGSQSGTLFYQGQAVDLPRSGSYTIPGVADIDTMTVDKIVGGIAITPMTVTLLDGSGATYTIGYAKVRITASGLN